MGSYVFCLRYADASNWAICKQTGLLGVRTSPSGINSAKSIQPGDTVFVWRGGTPKPGSGLLAKTRVIGSAQPASQVPWPDPQSYSYTIPFVLEEELATPVPDSFPGNQRGVKFGLLNSDLQKSLRPVSSDSEQRLGQCFHGDSSGGQPTPVAGGASGWFSDQDLIKQVEAAAVAATRAHLKHEGWLELRDCQQDGCGYDLLYEHPDGRLRPVEVKGTTGLEPRFLLTRLEHQVLSTDARARVYLVLDTLKTAQVQVLDWQAVQQLGVQAERWRVG